MPHRFAIVVGAGLHLAIALCAPAVHGAEPAVRITALLADGQPSAPAPQVRLPARGTAEVEFAFASDAPARLLYRLDGVDQAWRDLGQEMRLSVKLRTADGRLARSFDVLMRGTSPGWLGTEADSRFTARSEDFTAPDAPCALEALLFSGGAAEACGVLWLAGLQLQRLGEAGAAAAAPVDLMPAPDPGAAEAPPGWERDGSDSAMTRAAWVQGRWSIGLRDGDAQRFATWRLARTAWPRLAPGTRYRLSWQEVFSIGAAGPGRARYRALPPGGYRFHVTAATLEGLPTGAEALLDLDLPEPIWLRRWFWALAGLLLVLPLFGAWFTAARSRMRLAVERAERQRAVVQERARIAQDLHDDLGADLTQIALLSELAQRRLAPGHPARQPMDDIFRTAAALARQLDEAVWAVNPSHDSVEGLAGFLAKLVQDFLAPAGIRCRLLIPDELPALPVAATQRHHLVLAAKEVLHNVVRHAGAHLVTVALRVEGRRLRIEIRDDGRGMPAGDATDPGADGLRNLRARMAGARGTCVVTSDAGGTTVALSVDLAEGAVADGPG